MTVLEMHDAVQLGLDKSSSLQVAAFEPEDIDYWLNEAQIELIKQKMFGNNYRQENFDMGVKRADDLSILMVYSDELIYDVNNSSPNFRPHSYHPNVAVVNITETTMPKYMFFIGADFLVDDPNSPNRATKPMETKLISQSQIGQLVETPYNKPFLRNGYIYLKEGEVNVIYDPYATPESIYVSYLKTPKVLNRLVNDDDNTTVSELPEQVHPEIVALTVNLMLDNIGDTREQGNYIQLTRKE